MKSETNSRTIPSVNPTVPFVVGSENAVGSWEAGTNAAATDVVIVFRIPIARRYEPEDKKARTPTNFQNHDGFSIRLGIAVSATGIIRCPLSLCMIYR